MVDFLCECWEGAVIVPFNLCAFSRVFQWPYLFSHPDKSGDIRNTGRENNVTHQRIVMCKSVFVQWEAGRLPSTQRTCILLISTCWATFSFLSHLLSYLWGVAQSLHAKFPLAVYFKHRLKKTQSRRTTLMWERLSQHNPLGLTRLIKHNESF